jgi:pimeloyl-ACP methyl ester carboxylesterase
MKRSAVQDRDGGTAMPLRLAAGASLLAGVGWIGYSWLFVPHRMPLAPALVGERGETRLRAGRISYYVAGEGAPLLLVHSVNAAASAYEMKPIFERLATRRRVYAMDLPGFGFSERGARDYTIPLYASAVQDMVDVIAGDLGPTPVDALALSLGAEFLARAATERPERFRTLALVSPTGFERGAAGRAHGRRRSREMPGVLGFVRFPLWSQPLYDLLVTKPSIRFFLEKAWGSSEIDEGLLEYDYLSSHQPGARHAPFAFVAGRLFSNDIRTVYERLTLPVWMAHGSRGDFSDFSEAGWTAARSNWTRQRFDAGGLPQFEHPEAFLSAYERFLSGAPR